MRCSNCGKCCEKTEMELSTNYIVRLGEADYHREKFAVIDDDEVIQLRNIDGWCYFYSVTDRKCPVYENRPLGCYLYPVMYFDHCGAMLVTYVPWDIRFQNEN